MKILLNTIIFFLLFVGISFAQFSSFSGSNYDFPYEYRADYTGTEKTYEGWTFWEGSAGNTGSAIWRIAKNTYDGSYIVYTEFVGDGSFNYIWDNRFGYFGAAGLVQYQGIQVTFGGVNVQYTP